MLMHHCFQWAVLLLCGLCVHFSTLHLSPRAPHASNKLSRRVRLSNVPAASTAATLLCASPGARAYVDGGHRISPAKARGGGYGRDPGTLAFLPFSLACMFLTLDNTNNMHIHARRTACIAGYIETRPRAFSLLPLRNERPYSRSREGRMKAPPHAC